MGVWRCLYTVSNPATITLGRPCFLIDEFGRFGIVLDSHFHSVLLSYRGATGWVRWQIGKSGGPVYAARGRYDSHFGVVFDGGSPWVRLQAVLEDEARGGESGM